MTGYLWAAVVAVGAVAVFALATSLALSRKVRELSDRLTVLNAPFLPDLPEPGSPVPDFEATTVDGTTVGTADMAGPDRLVLFVDGSCSSCFDAVGTLREMHSSAGTDDPAPMAVVIGMPDERTALVAQLAPFARVVEETYEMPLARQFGVQGFPTALVVGGGVVRQATHRLDQLVLGTPA